MNRIELILHPIRARIIQAAAYETITTQAIAARMPDVPQTTLYRHINLLIDNGMLVVVRETRVRGTVERELRLAEESVHVELADIAALSETEQFHYFMVFYSTLMADFARAGQAESRPIEIPIALYSKDKIYATPEELAHLREQIDALISPYHQPSDEHAGQRRWFMSGIIMLDPDLKDESDKEKPE